MCQSNTNGTGYFYFEYFDEQWKDAQFGGVEGWWGLFNQECVFLVLPSPSFILTSTTQQNPQRCHHPGLSYRLKHRKTVTGYTLSPFYYTFCCTRTHFDVYIFPNTSHPLV